MRDGRERIKYYTVGLFTFTQPTHAMKMHQSTYSIKLEVDADVSFAVLRVLSTRRSYRPECGCACSCRPVHALGARTVTYGDVGGVCLSGLPPKFLGSAGFVLFIHIPPRSTSSITVHRAPRPRLAIARAAACGLRSVAV